MTNKQIEPYLNRFNSKTGIYDLDDMRRLSNLDESVRRRILQDRDRQAENAPLQGKPRPTRYQGVSID